MADSYPALGIKFDFAEIARGRSELQAIRKDYQDVAAAQQGVSKAEQEAFRKTLNEVRDTLRTRMSLTKQMFGDERREAENTLAFKTRMWRQQSAEVERASREQAAAAKKAEQEIRDASEKTLGFKTRMWRQQLAEAERAARAEAQAAAAAEREAKRASDGRYRLMLRELAEGERVAKERARAEADAESKIRREAQQTLEFRMRMNRQQAAEAERAAQEQIAANRRIDAASRAKWLGGGGGGPGGPGGPGGGDGGEGRRGIIDALGLRGAYDSLAQSANRLGGVMVGLRTSLANVRSAVFDVRTAVGVLLAGMIVSPIVQMVDAMTSLEARTRLYAARASDVPYTFQAIYRTAQDARAPLEAVAKLYTRLAPLAKDLGRSQMDMLRTTGTVAKSFVIGGSTSAEATSSSQQLAQALGANRLGGDELRSLSENAPVLLMKISQALGMNTGEFIKWAHAGKANAKVVLEAIDKSAAEIDRMFKAMPMTIGQAITGVTNAFSMFVNEVDRATGLSVEVAGFIAQFTALLEDPETVRNTAAAIQFMGEAFNVAGQAIKTVVDFTPAIAALIVAAGAARILPPIYAAFTATLISTAMAAPQASTGMVLLSTAGRAVAASTAAAVASMRGMLALVGGPLGIALIAAAAAYAFLSTNSMSAAEGQLKFTETTQATADAISRASAFITKWGGDASKMTDILLKLNGVQDEQTKGMDEATKAAYARFVNEKALTLALLERARAESIAAAAELRRGAIAARIMGSDFYIDSQIAVNKEVRENAIKNRDAVEARASGYETSAGNLMWAAGPGGSIDQAIGQVKGLKFDATAPGAVEGGNRPSAATTTKGLDGAINRVARLRAEVEGLEAQLKTISANPLDELAARIAKAGDEAGAGFEAGKGSKFQDEVVGLAKRKEELTIRHDLISASLKQARAESDEQAQTAITADGREKAADVMMRYFESGQYGYQNYQKAVEGARDAETQAAISTRELSIAQAYGVTKISDISAAYQKATGVTKEEADAVQAAAQKAMDASRANILYAASMQTAEERTKALQDATANFVGMMRGVIDLEEMAGASSAERDADDKARVIQMRLLTKAMKEGVELTDEEALARARVLALVIQQHEETARLKINIQDNIRDTFIETGKLNMTPLIEGVKKAFRKGIYDALLAKPLDIVVNAVVDVTTTGLRKMLQQLIGGGTGAPGSGSSTGGFLGALGQFLGFTSGNSGGGGGGTPAPLGTNANFGGISVPPGGGGTPKQDSNGMGMGGGLIGQLGAFMGIPVIGWIGAAIAAIGMSDQIADSFVENGKKRISAVGGNERIAENQAIPNSWRPIIAFFGNGNSNNGGNLTFSTDGFFDVGGSKATKKRKEQLASTGDFISSMLDSLANIGINARGIITKIQAGDRDGTKIYTDSGTIYKSKETSSDGIAQLVVKAILSEADFQDPALKAIVDQMLAANRNWEQILDRMEKFMAAMELRKDVERKLLSYTDPNKAKILDLRDDQIERRKNAKSYADLNLYTPEQLSSMSANLTALEAEEIKELINSFGESLDGATNSLEAYTKAQEDIAAYLKNLMTGSLSPLAPDAKLDMERSQWQTQLGLAQGGNYRAFSNITSDAEEYLTSAQQFYGSTQAYADIFNQVTSALDALANQEIDDPMIEAIEQATADLIAAIQAQGLQLAAAAAATTAAVNTMTEVLGDITGTGLDNLGGVIGGAANNNALINGGLANIA